MSTMLNKETGELRQFVHTPDYWDDDKNVKEPWLDNPTEADIAQFKYVPTSAEVKAKEIATIDTQIAYEMTRGYTYNDKVISTSLAAQANWSNVITRHNAGMPVTLPYPVSLVDSGVMYINTVAEVLALFKEASEAIEARHNTLLTQRASIVDGS